MEDGNKRVVDLSKSMSRPSFATSDRAGWVTTTTCGQCWSCQEDSSLMCEVPLQQWEVVDGAERVERDGQSWVSTVLTPWTVMAYDGEKKSSHRNLERSRRGFFPVEKEHVALHEELWK